MSKEHIELTHYIKLVLLLIEKYHLTDESVKFANSLKNEVLPDIPKILSSLYIKEYGEIVYDFAKSYNVIVPEFSDPEWKFLYRMMIIEDINK
jgi:hypothetical protein